MNKGDLVPDSDVIEMIKKHYKKFIIILFTYGILL